MWFYKARAVFRNRTGSGPMLEAPVARARAYRLILGIRTHSDKMQSNVGIMRSLREDGRLTPCEAQPTGNSRTRFSHAQGQKKDVC